MNQATEERVVRLTRTLSASAADVYNALVDPDQLARWYGPEGFRVTDVESDATPGGRFRALMLSDAGEEGHFIGIYKELIPGERLVMSWGFEYPDNSSVHDSELVFELTEVSPELTELTLIHHLGSATPGGFEGVTEGWTGALNRLVSVFETA